MTFRDLEIGAVIICDGVAMVKIPPCMKNKQYVNAIDCTGEYHYLEDDGIHIFESIE